MPDAALAALPDLSLAALLAIWAVILLAAVLRAFTGFGFALAAVPAFSVVMVPTQAVVLSAALALTISLTSLRSYWGQAPLRPLLPLAGMSLLGTLAGAALLARFSPVHFQLWIGLLVIAACLLLTFYRPRHGTHRMPVAAGTGLASGLMNGLFAIPGPPVIIYTLATERHPLRSRSLLMMFFLFSALNAMFAYTLAGFVGWHSLWLFLWAFPAMFLGDKLGFRLFRRYGDVLYRRVAVATLLVIGLLTTARGLTQWG
jgi:uncharacterized membrane protein YfcA